VVRLNRTEGYSVRMRQDLKDKYFERLGVNTSNDASRANKVNGENGADWKDNPYPGCLGVLAGLLLLGGGSAYICGWFR